MAKELVYRVRIDYDGSSAKSGTQAIERSQENAGKAIDETTQKLRRQENAQESVSQASKSYQRNQSRANQVLFSYGDLLNDAQQFQFGFSNGLRAIGNNIGFAAEGISNLSTKAGGLGGAFRALGSSLLGPGGLILGLNVAVTAFTVFGDKLFGAEDKAKDFREELVEMRKELDLLSPRAQTASNIIDRLFPDASESQNIRRNLQALVNIEGQLQTRLDELQGEGGLIAQAERRLEIVTAGRQELLDLVSREVITERQAVNIIRNRAQIEQRARSQLNTLQQEEAALQKSIQDVQKDQVEQRSELQQIEAFLNSAYGEQLQKQSAIRREQEAALQAAKARQSVEADQPEDVILGNEEELDAALASFNSFMDKRKEILNRGLKQEQQLIAQANSARVMAENQVLNALSALRQQFAQNSKPLALALLAVEKALAISRVIVDTTQKAAQATATGFALAANPATAPLAANAFAQASAIKTAGAVAAAAIAAQGLAQGAGIVSGGNGGNIGTAGAGSINTTPNAQQGIDTTDVSSAANIGQRNQPQTNIVLAGEFDSRMVSIKAEEGDRRRRSQSVTIQND